MYDPTKPYIPEIKRLVRETWSTPYVEVKDRLVYKKFNYPEFHKSDGIGTKYRYRWPFPDYHDPVHDAFAMNINDCAVERAIPYALIDHIFLPEDNHRAFVEIARSLVSECKPRLIAITGGESSVHEGTSDLEISIAMLSFVPAPKSNRFQTGDWLIGIASNGLQSNGFTKVREVLGKNTHLRSDLFCPTPIYWDAVMAVNENIDVHCMIHVTGGAYTRLKDVLGTSLDALIFFNPLFRQTIIFDELFRCGITEHEMYSIFNCGVGFIIGVRCDDTLNCIRIINQHDLKADVVGIVSEGSGHVGIASRFSRNTITL